MTRAMRILAALAGVATALGATGPAAADTALPPPGGSPDYQLGTPYAPAAGVAIVARDRSSAPARGAYSICYVNAFQTQPGEVAAWPGDVLLRGRDGSPVHDPDWPDEILLDTRSPAQRATIQRVVSDRIAGCAESGYQAVEFDNLDTYTRSAAMLRREDAVALARTLVATAHQSGLAAAQKNAAEDAAAFRAAGFDFAVAEECAAFQECAAYTRVYGAGVIDIEYTDNLPRSFETMCADAATPRSTVLRDRDLVAPSEPGYHFALCPT